MAERKSRVLAYLEQQKQEPEAPAEGEEEADAPFLEGFDEAFGLDEFGTKGLW